MVFMISDLSQTAFIPPVISPSASSWCSISEKLSCLAIEVLSSLRFLRDGSLAMVIIGVERWGG